MSQWLLSIKAVDADNTPVSLRFSESGFVDAAGHFFEPRIISPALVTVAANDGGLLSVFGAASVGDVVLANADGGLAFLADLALDGREVSVSFVSAGLLTRYFSGTVAKVAEQSDQLVVSLRARQEALALPFTLARFAGSNALPMGLEGGEEVMDQVKPQLFGFCKAVAPVLVNPALLIYQVSDRADCRIAEVFVGGVKLVRFKTTLKAVKGSSVVKAVSTFPLPLDTLPKGSEVSFGSSVSVYTVSSSLANGQFSVSPPLAESVLAGASVNVLNFFRSEADLQVLSPTMAAAANKGKWSVSVALSESIRANDWLQFSGHATMYQVKSVKSGLVVLKSALKASVTLGEALFVVGDKPLLYGCFQGFIRLSSPPSGTLVVNAFSVNALEAGAVVEQVAGAAGLALDSASKTVLDAAGSVGLWVNSELSFRDLLDRLLKSVGGFYWVVDQVLFAGLLSVPGLPVWVIEDWQVLSLSRLACGLGSNGVPLKSVTVQFDKFEAVQSAFATGVAKDRQARFKVSFLSVSVNSGSAAAQFLSAEALVFESLLRDRANALAVAGRLLAVLSVRRDVVELVCHYSVLPDVSIGDSVRVVSPRLGYDAGRSLVVVSLTLDCLRQTLTLRAIG
jgi:hypothetical protein